MSELLYAIIVLATYLVGFGALVAVVAWYIHTHPQIETDPVDSEHEWVDNRQEDYSRRTSVFDDDNSGSLFSDNSPDFVHDVNYYYMPQNIYHHDD
ncbi:MAG: hypothetical protein ABSD38_20965 [Syntrophorhabdales bacterium]|jgi:hypothetical protein